ncbi:type I restriction endonuclease subunit R, EcoR124 family (plasmid) [Methylomonas sp. MED-D]|uniref:type I restriction endonuclease subunit R, EcoR124 family n=1 Tax=Methylomonas sp. MED-D TaxID=3418768 RepID=UPI003D0887A1
MGSLFLAGSPRAEFINHFKEMQRLKAQQGKGSDSTCTVQQLKYEFVLFASAIIDFHYIMDLIAKFTQNISKQNMTREALSANLLDQRNFFIAYIINLPAGQSLNESAIRDCYQTFITSKAASDLAAIADKHGLKAFVATIMIRMIFDGEKLSNLLAPLTQGREISGLAVYE